MKTFFAKLASVALATPVLVSAAQAETIRIGLAEPPSDEMAAFFVALDRAEANGVDYEWTAFAEEELAILDKGKTVVAGRSVESIIASPIVSHSN